MSDISIQEKRGYVSFVSSILIFIFYYRHILGLLAARQPDAEEELRFWGAAILIFVPVSVVVQIVIHIIFSIFNAATSDEHEPDFTDELDKLIDLKSMRIGYLSFLIGFFVTMGLLVFQVSLTVMFKSFLFSMFISGMIAQVSQIYYYRRGI